MSGHWLKVRVFGWDWLELTVGAVSTGEGLGPVGVASGLRVSGCITDVWRFTSSDSGVGGGAPGARQSVARSETGTQNDSPQPLFQPPSTALASISKPPSSRLPAEMHPPLPSPREVLESPYTVGIGVSVSHHVFRFGTPSGGETSPSAGRSCRTPSPPLSFSGPWPQSPMCPRRVIHFVVGVRLAASAVVLLRTLRPKGPSWEKTKFTSGKIWSGHFWCTDFWVPDLPPPSLLIPPPPHPTPPPPPFPPSKHTVCLPPFVCHCSARISTCVGSSTGCNPGFPSFPPPPAKAQCSVGPAGGTGTWHLVQRLAFH